MRTKPNASPRRGCPPTTPRGMAPRQNQKSAIPQGARCDFIRTRSVVRGAIPRRRSRSSRALMAAGSVGGSGCPSAARRSFTAIWAACLRSLSARASAAAGGWRSSRVSASSMRGNCVRHSCNVARSSGEASARASRYINESSSGSASSTTSIAPSRRTRRASSMLEDSCGRKGSITERESLQPAEQRFSPHLAIVAVLRSGEEHPHLVLPAAERPSEVLVRARLELQLAGA